MTLSVVGRDMGLRVLVVCEFSGIACLWLEGLPKLTPTNIVEGREAKIHRMPPGADRWKNRSRTYVGIAQAMASQWSNPK